MSNLQDTSPKPFVFVLMPFDTKFADTYEFGIKGAATEVGAYAERLDEQVFTEGMLEQIFNQISKADVIVADMTGRNPNVFYEVGYAHALNKITLLLTQNTDDIPFDLRHRQHIVYSNINELRSQLIKYLTWAIAEAGRRAKGAGSQQLAVFIGWNNIAEIKTSTEKPVIHLSVANDERAFAVPVTVTNLSSSIAPPMTYVYLFTPGVARLVPCTVTPSDPNWHTKPFLMAPVRQPIKEVDGRPTLHYRLNARIPSIPTRAVEEFTFFLMFPETVCPLQQDLLLRLHSEPDYFDYEFALHVDVRPEKKIIGVPQVHLQ